MVDDSDFKSTILDVIGDLVGDFLYYDRKGNETIPLGAIEDAVKRGEITIDEMVDRFRKELQRSIKP